MFSKCNHSLFTVFQLHGTCKRAALSRSCLHVSCVCISPPITVPLTPPYLPSFLLSDHHFVHYFSPDLFSHLANWGKKRKGPYWKHLQTTNQKYCILNNDYCDLWCGRKCCKMGKPSFPPTSTKFLKAFHFWIVETRECFVLKLTREVPISS